MASMRSTIERVASLGTIDVRETYFRHAAPNRDAFAGGQLGRWGATFPVIYLGRPEAGVVIEAYRHLVEDAGVPPEHVGPRILYTVPVTATQVLDLTDPDARDRVELSDDDVSSEVGDYAESQRVAAAAHQLRLHGILAPAAHGRGTTLALFRERLPLDEIPVPSAQHVWDRLPDDPRRLRIVRGDDATGSTSGLA
jgi:RES domain-containing protein